MIDNVQNAAMQNGVGSALANSTVNQVTDNDIGAMSLTTQSPTPAPTSSCTSFNQCSKREKSTFRASKKSCRRTSPSRASRKVCKYMARSDYYDSLAWCYMNC